MLVVLAAWLGVELRDGLSDQSRRDLVRHAAELHRRRGTASGLELALRIALPGVPLRVQDGGGVAYFSDPDAPPKPTAASFVVYCDEPLPEYELAAIARLIEQHKPAHVSYRLRVKTTPAPPGGGP